MKDLTPLDRPLTETQKAVLAEIVRYQELAGEPCTVRYLARRFDKAPSTIQQHVYYLRRKGFLRSAGSPAVPRRRAFLARSR